MIKKIVTSFSNWKRRRLNYHLQKRKQKADDRRIIEKYNLKSAKVQCWYIDQYDLILEKKSDLCRAQRETVHMVIDFLIRTNIIKHKI